MSEEVIRSRLWREEAVEGSPFSTQKSICAGYDVYGELIHKATWFEYLYLLFRQERPNAQQLLLLESLALVIANPGPRDLSVRAAMNAGVGGSTSAASLMAALAVGAGEYGGAHEVALAIELWQTCHQDKDCWLQHIQHPEVPEVTDIWTTMEHVPGFDPNADESSPIVLQSLAFLNSRGGGECLSFLLYQRTWLEEQAGCPLSFTGVGFYARASGNVVLDVAIAWRSGSCAGAKGLWLA
jgi:citrate synthase